MASNTNGLEVTYRRLPGRGLRRIGPVALTRISSQLWLGDDHLLSVDSSGYAEDYRRFYYRDIQALQMRQTDRGKIWTIFLGIFSGVGVLVAFGLSGVAAAVLWSIAGLLLLALLINFSRGPTCVCHLSTAVHTEHLPSLNRVRVARKALTQLKSLIEQAQGTLMAEEVAERLQAGAMTGPGSTAAPPVHAGTGWNGPRVETVSAYQGRYHAVLFSVLLVDASVSLVDLFLNHLALTLVASLLTAAAAIFTVVALVRQQDSALSGGVKGVTWTTLGYVAVSFLIGYLVFFGLAMQNPGLANDQLSYLRMLSEMSPFESPWLMALYLFAFFSSLSLGLVGWLMLRSWRREQPAENGPELKGLVVEPLNR